MKRGQITVFIVVGIVILFAVGLVLYLASLQQPLQLFVPKETELQQYIGMCLQNTAIDALNQLGATGGYINVPQSIALNPRAYFSFAPGTQPKIPFWYYAGQPRVPTRQFMQDQLSSFILNSITPCFQDFSIFKDQFEISLLGNASVDTTIADNSVVFKLNYPLQTKDKLSGQISTIDFVSRTINVKLGKMQKMAADILSSEDQNLFFENLTMDLLSTNNDFPFTGMEFNCQPKIWRKSDLITLAKNMVYYNIQRTTVEGNPFQVFSNSDLYAKNHFVMPMSTRYSDLGVFFFYPQTSRFEMHVRPNDQEILTSNLGKSPNPLLNFMCINTFHFTYDIEYPLLATIKDSNAFSGQGYSFNFAFPVTINHNAGDKTDFPITISQAPDVNYNFCSQTSANQADIRVKDAFTNEELYGANVTYTCVRVQCPLGSTNAETGIYRLQANLPSGCTNGVFTASADNYLDGSAQYLGNDVTEIFVKPLKAMRVNFVKHDSDNFARTDSIKPIETVLLTVTSTDDPSFQQIYLSGENNTEFKLVNGDEDYKIDAMLLQGDRLIGGYEGNWNVTYGDIADKSTVTFNLVQKIPIAVTDQEQIDSADYLFNNKDYQVPLKPTFS